MQIAKDAPREQVGIQSVILSIPYPFKEGYVLKPNEASAMNQTFKENIRNNLAPKVKEMAGKKASVADIQKAVDAYVIEYEFGVKKSGGTKDPVMSEAISLAKGQVRKAMQKQGLKIADFKAADITTKAEKLVQAHPQFLAKAKKVIETREMDFEVDGV